MPIPESPTYPEDTIVAVATPPGRGGIGIVRLSGVGAVSIVKVLTRRRTSQRLRPRQATLAELVNGDGEVVDQVLITLFPRPHSYTAEDVAEMSCHGSPVVLAFAVERAIELGARLAKPGEFTERAYLNGRLDLSQAEAVRDLIDATTLYQARVATQQAQGALARRLAPIKKQLCDLIALLEAGIDFAEDDIDVAGLEQILGRLDPVIADILRLAESYRYGKVVYGGITLAILGRPNVGKSSLFNRLLEQDRAIVTTTAGTTRDSVAEFCSIHGLPVKLIDTAGIRTTSDVIEAQGVEKSYEALADADLIVVVIDLSEPLEATDKELLARAAESECSLVVGNKSDLLARAELPEPHGLVSAITGEGLDELRRRIYDHAVPQQGSEQEAGFITNIRHATLLRESLASLERGHAAVRNNVPHEMVLLDLYSALRPIDQITGATTVEDILDSIFSTFCIGK